MRILAIRGGGLASLAKPFAIDLTREPLAGTGLFAITGETGAGKSTILDALCLALYGDYPRASVERREKVVDPSDVAIQVSDPRNILTRGEGEGVAEVEFIGVDAIAYRARWAARRAHSKATGKLQKVERTLERCDGTAVVAATIESVNAAVVEKTGFTFEEFRRSVLLAQGEFDAFLLADDAQRAALLEKITGTEVYSRISMRVFEETGVREAALKLIEAQREAIGLKTGDELAALDREEGEALTLRERTNAELAAIDALLACAVRVAETRRAVTLRTREVEERDGAVSAAVTVLAAAKQNSARHEAASRAVDAEIAELEPIWQAAIILDDQIRQAEAERLMVVRGLEAAAMIEATARDALARLQDERREAETEHGDVLSALERDRRHALLADRQAHICAELDACATLQHRAGEVAGELGRVDREITWVREQIADAEAAMARDRDERTTRANLIAARRTALEAMHPDELSHRDAELLDLDAGIGRALEAVRQRDRADAALREVEADTRAVNADETAQRTIAVTARMAHADRTRAREELAHLADLADATLSKQAAHLRSVLVEGEPCPVCGATDHPFSHGEDATAEIARGIRERRAALDREVADLSRRISEAETACSRAAARREQGLRATAAAQPQLAAAHDDLTSLLPSLRARLLLCGLGGEPIGDAAVVTEESLDRVRAACRSARSAVAEDRRRARVLADEIAALDRRHATLLQTIEEAAAACEALRREVSGKETVRAVVETRLAALREQLSGKLDEIAPLLAAADIGAQDVAYDVTVVRRRVETLAAAYGALVARYERSVERLQALGSAVALAEKDVGSAAANRERLEQEIARRRAAVDATTVERAKLLGGAATAAHREAALERQAVARHALKAADVRSAEAALTLAGLRSTLESVRALLAEARMSEDAAHARLRETAAGAGADAAAADALLEGSPDELRRQQTHREAIAARLEEVQKRLVLIAAARENDRQARARADALAGEIDLKQRELKVWQAVNAAIGQADGAKFRRFAQSVTLNHLVALANVQLAALNPRYRLGRSALGDLALEVIDRDMGDEIRSPRSLSGGERFLVSLALALALSGLEGRQSFVDTLFIDEGFGSLDGDTLDCAIGALESLQGQGRKVGVITHVAAMVEQIPVQVRVEKRGSGRSVVRIVDGSAERP